MSNFTKIILFFLIVGYAIDPFSLGFIFGYITFIVLLLYVKGTLKEMDTVAGVLLLFSAIYSLFYVFNPDLGTQFILIYAIIPTTFYLVGKILYQRDRSENYNTISLIIIGLAFSFTSMASVFNAIIEDGFVTIKRDVPIIWTGETIPATNMAASFVMNMCIPGLLILGIKKLRPHAIKLLLLVVYGLSLTCVLRLGSRTHLVITLFAMAIAILYRFRKQTALQNLVLFFLVFLGINLVVGYLSLDADSDVFSAYADRMDSKTNGIDTAGGRTWKWEKSVEFMFTKPVGWELEEIGYAHNLWFDVLRVGGVICLFLLLNFTIKVLRQLYKLYTLRPRIYLLDGQLLLYTICFFLVFFVEPIMEGYFTVFSLFCLTMGYLKSHVEHIGQIDSKDLSKIKNPIVDANKYPRLSDDGAQRAEGP